MADIDKAVELAREVVAAGEDNALEELVTLARAVLAMAGPLAAAVNWHRAVEAYNEADALTRRCEAGELKAAHGRADLAWYEMRRAQTAALDAIRALDAEARRG